MDSITFNVSFSKRLLKLMDRLAKQEARSRSEILREAVRAYVERKLRWKQIFTFWEREARRKGYKATDVGKLITEARSHQDAA